MGRHTHSGLQTVAEPVPVAEAAQCMAFVTVAELTDAAGNWTGPHDQPHSRGALSVVHGFTGARGRVRGRRPIGWLLGSQVAVTTTEA